MLVFVFVHVQDHLCDQHVDPRLSHLEEWDHQVEDQPHIHHLDVRCLGKILGHGDEHGGQDKHHGQVHRDDGLEEEGLEVVGHVRDDDEEQGGDVNSEDGAQQPPDEESLRRTVDQPNVVCYCFPRKSAQDICTKKRNVLFFSENLPKTTSTAMLPPESRLILVCL